MPFLHQQKCVFCCMNKFRQSAVLVLVLLTAVHSALSQDEPKGKKGLPSYFGLQVKPLIPGDFLSKSKISVFDSSFRGDFSQQFGYSFGAIVRVGLTKLISLETGISQVKRNYKVDFSLPDSNLTGSTGFGILSYDIPINAMFYIQLSEKIFTNASLGVAAVFYPSNVAATVIVNDRHLFVSEGRRNRHIDFEINGNLGFELRTDKKGFFYIGASARVPFSPIFKVAASYEYDNSVKKLAIGEVNGAYLSVDLRYFFPNVNNKGVQFNKGPIMQ